jgi:hypothetical protein
VRMRGAIRLVVFALAEVPAAARAQSMEPLS